MCLLHHKHLLTDIHLLFIPPKTPASIFCYFFFLCILNFFIMNLVCVPDEIHLFLFFNCRTSFFLCIMLLYETSSLILLYCMKLLSFLCYFFKSVYFYNHIFFYSMRVVYITFLFGLSVLITVLYYFALPFS